MKKLLMTTILASTISFSAIADVTKSDIEKGIAAGNSAVCNTLNHGVEFNKTELSQFDKCWLSIHKAEEKSGVSGNIFWVKVGNDFVSMPIKTLSQSGSKAKAKEIVKEKVTETIIKGISEELHNEIVSQRDILISALGKTPNVDTIRMVADRIAELQDAESELSYLTSIVPAEFRALENFDVVAHFDRILTNINATYSDEFLKGLSDAKINLLNVRKVTNNDNAGTAVQLNWGERFGIKSTITRGYNERTPNRPIYGWGDSLNEAIEDAIEQAYESGYQDGYEDGYADGYADGFRDGVASVQ